MSDVSQGPGWWLASDDKWYPPETAPPPPPSPALTPSSSGMNNSPLASTGKAKKVAVGGIVLTAVVLFAVPSIRHRIIPSQSSSDSQVCSTLARDMQESASGRLDYSQVSTFAEEAASSGDRLSSDAKSFESQFTSSPAGANNINLYPTSAVVADCTNAGVTGLSNSGSTGSSPAPSYVSTVSPTEAYRQGYSWGQLAANGGVPPNSEFMASVHCKRTFAGNPAAQSAFLSGCMAALGY